MNPTSHRAVLPARRGVHSLLPALQPLGVRNIEVFSFPNGPDLNQALVGGKLDVASYGDTPALIARGSGLQTRLPAINAVGLNAVVVVKDPSITSLKDLAGKKTACRPAPTSTGICKARCAKRASRPS